MIFIWRKRYRFALLLVLAVGGGSLLNVILKVLFKRPRPQFWISSVKQPTSFSFPSGHAMAAFCLFGFLIWLGFKLTERQATALRWVWAGLMSFFILTVGLSRIYLGVHYPTDVLAGYLCAGVWLIMLLSGAEVYDRRKQQTFERPQTIKVDQN